MRQCASLTKAILRYFQWTNQNPLASGSGAQPKTRLGANARSTTKSVPDTMLNQRNGRYGKSINLETEVARDFLFKTMLKNSAHFNGASNQRLF